MAITQPVTNAVRVRPPLGAWRRGFIARIALMSLLFQSFAIAACALWLMRAAGLGAVTAGLLAAGLHAAGFSIFLHRLVWWIDDVKTPPWYAWCVEVLYAAYGTGCFVAAFMALPAMAIWAALRLSVGTTWSALDVLAGPLFLGWALGLYGSTAGRLWARVRRVEVFIDDLPEAFDGFRIAQWSDVHCGPYLPRWVLSRWVEATHALAPDVVCLTGDLITTGEGYVDDVGWFAAQLKAPHGVFACMGNHDYFQTETAVVDALLGAGVRLQRNRGETLTRGDAALWIGGLDDHFSKRDRLDEALATAPAGATRVLLSHDPRHWQSLCDAGVELSLSGHTHAGQIGLPWPLERVNLYRVVHRWSDGLYTEHGRSLYVSRGLGITGVPSRIFMWPEIALIVLRRRVSTR